MLPEPLSFPIRLFTVTLIPAKTHPMPALDAVTDLITEVFDEISGKVFLHTHEDEICGLISNESLVASGRTLDKKLARLQRQVTTYFLDAPVIIYHDRPIHWLNSARATSCVRILRRSPFSWGAVLP